MIAHKNWAMNWVAIETGTEASNETATIGTSETSSPIPAHPTANLVFNTQQRTLENTDG